MAPDPREQLRAPAEVPAWLLRTPLLGSLLEHLRRRPTWPGHAAFALAGLSFLLTDMLALRAMASLSCVLAVLFNCWHPVGRALWLPIYWNVVYVLVNIVYIGMLLAENIASLSAEEKVIFREHFDGCMSAKDFGRLVRMGTVEVASERQMLLSRGKKPEHLYLVFQGKPVVEVEDVKIIRGTASGSGLVGEMSFISAGAANATVWIEPGCKYLRWDCKELRRLLERDMELRRGLELAIARELMRKLVWTNSALVRATLATRREGQTMPLPRPLSRSNSCR
ncbi:hypothetical protein T492DRAFT_1066046 [Pavlovales sp. CCMP2436]|nr:hypothetical protein T492DRAFT_1066046 [Pavlovales sp. CCMP2436]